jgi:hypothetical protein
MSEEGEYEEQNLDEFLKNVSNILVKKEDDRKDKIIQTINNHLLTIINDQTLMENFFSTISSIIFLSESSSQSSNSIRKKKNFNKDPFILYPIVYSFNPSITVNYIDFFLNSLHHSISDENKMDFSFLSLVFSDIVSIFYNNNSNNDTLDIQEQEKLYEKLFDFINDNIKVNKKTERYMGCLLLAEFIEKCPLINEEKYLGPLFKEFSSYLSDRWFQCKLDLLNCILTLIYTVKKNFSPHANVCLFRILDYLTDSDWMKRKLTINIVYTLVYYCRDQIIDVKENIIEFLNVIKKDDVEEVREMCLQTLKFIEESYPKTDIIPKEKNFEKEVKINNSQIKNIINNLNSNINTQFSPVITEEKKYEFSEDSLNNLDKNKNNCNSDINNIFDNKNEYVSKNNNYFDNGFYIYNLIKGKSKSKNSLNNNNSSSQSLKKNDKNNESGVFNKNTCSTRTLDNQSNKNKLTKYNTNKNFGNNFNTNTSYNNPNKKEIVEKKKLNKSTEQRAVKMDKKNSSQNNNKKIKKIDTNADLREKFKKEKLLLQEVEKQINERRSNQPKITSSSNQNAKKKTFKFSDSKNKNNKKNIYVNKINELPKENKSNINSQQQPESNDTDNDNTKYRESIDMIISNNNNSNNLNQNENYIDNKEENIETPNNDHILEQLNKIQENQNNLMKMINNLKNTVDMNYFLLDKRITKLESYHNINNNNKNLNENKQISNDFLYKNEQQNQIIDDEMKIEIIKNKYISGKYNEALSEAKQNDKYLFRLLPLIVSENIPKIDLSLIEEVISELSLKLPKLCMGEGKNNINIILSFFNQVIRSRINLKLIIQINLKDILQLMKTEYILKLSQNDITNIDIILRSLKV